MFIPLHDENPLRIVPFQIVTIAIIVVTTLVFAWQLNLAEELLGQFTFAYGMVPAVLLDQRVLPVGVAQVPAEVTLLTYMLLHADFWHLIGNMLFLWVFGDNIEDSMGHFRFFVFYLLCGVAAALAHGFIEPDSIVPMIGASGAVAGILGAYLMLHPKVKVLVLAFGRIPVRLPAYLLIGAWFGFQFFSIYMGTDNVAWWAHVGGFLAGMILIIPFRKKDIPLFDFGTAH